ncbi:unnamed protein product [Orchesella dallaii]|uniref:CUB domain-containing protein n=1 Tax=Orchesella dallaii TaxID=48710 RepID=A0ABP1PLX9_9HEXA
MSFFQQKMEFKILFVLSFWVAVPLTLEEIHGSVKFHPMTQKRSIKDTFPKDDYTKTSAINYVRNKIFSLEDSVKKAEERIQQLSNQNEELEESMLVQKSLLQTIAGEFSGIQKGLSSHGYRLNDLDELTNPTKTFFITSNQTCGGVLVGEMGSILFSRRSSANPRLPSNCMWTVRAKNREFIKVSKLVTLSFSSNNKVYAIEITKMITSGNDASSQLPHIKTTELLDNTHHLFAGPVIFIMAAINSQSYIDLHLQFEGIGKIIEKNTFFAHATLVANPMGNFSSSEMTTWSPSSLEEVDGKTNYTLDYTTIVVSNFTTKVHLQAVIGNGGCSEGESFIVISDLKENQTSVNDCCKVNCTGRNSLINYDNPYIILIHKKFQRPLTFNLTWIADPVYLPLSNASSCGGIVGGTDGNIRYKPSLPYGNNERCIWVIVPQSIPRSSIEIKVLSNGITDTDDHLYVMELTDVNGQELEGGPKITSLAQRSSSYVAQSREVYIVFYTDSAVSGYGFSVEWTSSGDLVRDGSDIETQFEYYKNDNGSALSVSKKAMFTNYLYHVFIFTPKLSPTYNSGLQLELNQTFPAFDEKNCVQAQFYIPVHGVLTKTPISCNHSSQAFLQNADGMAVIVMMKSQTAHPNLAMDFNWKQGPLAVNRTEVVVQDDRCGGVIIGDMGVLKYKTDRHILVNERCLWLLNAPTSTNITFKLENNGFDNGLYSGLYTFILVTTINPSTGKLRNDTKEINRANMSVKMNGSMIVIAFLSGATGRSTGFSLRFSSRDTFKTQSEYSYSLRHLSNTHGTVEYDGTGRINNVFVTASSAFRSEVNPTVDPQTAIDWSGGLFRKANDSCNYDSLKFYQPTYYIDGNGWLFGWLTGAKFPNHNETICPDVLSVPEKKSVFNSTSGFLAIYKPVSNPQKSGENETNHFRFKYYATVVYSSCTGTITEKSGHISYKENSQYSNRERCSWQINIPKAEMVTFYLESSGLGQCCDFVTIRSEDNLDGVRLSLANRNATMRGGKGEVTFSSDGSRTGYGFRLQFETIEDLDVRGQACGGVIQQQSGSITFARHESPSMPYHNFSTYYPSTCVWTVRANDSAAIKISTHPARKTLFSSYNSDTYLLEIVKTNTSENRTSSQIPQIKITKLQKNMQYMLTGPTIFVVTSLATQNGIDLYLQFEGVGKLEQNDTSYTHEALLGSSGSFNSNELEALSSPLLTILDDNNNNFTFDYTTIVVSNFSTKVHLQAIVGNGGCSNGESFFVITDVTKNRTVIKDCCKSECAGNNSLITYDNPFIILISKKYQEPFNFNFTWEADRIYPSSYNGSGQLTMPKCGEVLGGTSGTIEYQLYDKNDRCIWVIVPQPLPTSSIVIKVNSNGIYDSNDLLYMMELTDINGEELEDSPRITRFVGRNTYEAQGREVYIVFYADSSGSGTGFSLTWSLQGQIIEPRNDVATRFAFLKSINGSAANVWRKSLFTSSSYYAFIFTPTIPSTYKYGLQLHLQFNETLVGDGGNNCTRDELTIFSALNDLLTKTKGICDKPGEVILDEADGMAVIVLNSRQNVSSEMQLDFKWMDESNSASNSDLIENGDKCGGVIIGSRGVLSYKLDSNYLNGERCIWLLHSPNSTSITLKLLDDGFEKCCDYILVTTIDPQSGTLRNNTQQITRANRTQILQDPMVIIQFRSDWPDSRTGFALRFTAHGHRQHDYDFNLRHTSDSTGTFEFPAPGWNDTATGTRDIIHVMASSIVTKDDSDDHPRIPLAINWSGGVFQKANDSCDYNSIVFYEPTFFSYGGWITRAQFPNLNETLCSDEVTVPGKQKFYSSIESPAVKLTPYHDITTVKGSVANLTFTSDSSITAKGFRVSFGNSTVIEGGGNNPSPTYIYKLRHVSDENGTITYPGSEWGDGPLASNEIFVLASSMNLRDWDDDQVSLNLHWDSGVFRKSNESCEYGSVMFYTSPKSNGWQTVGRIPSENATSSCSNVVTVPPKKRLFNFEDFSYLAVYKPNSGNQPQENATHFNFTFEMTVSSVEAFKGIKLPARILASTNQTATISGSVAIVTFSSNARVIGYGFRLLFSSASEATAEYPYTYILGHSHQQKLIEFSQQVEPNQVVIFAYGRPFKHPSLVNITSFRPQVNESCYSDSLAVYEAYGKSSSDAFALKKTFTATDTGSIGTSTSCRAFDENQFSTCENIGDCSDAPDGSVVHLNTSSYVVIYSSVNVTGSLQLRGFALTSEL